MLLIFFLQKILDVERVSSCPILLENLDCYFLFVCVAYAHVYVRVYMPVHSHMEA